jgi:hypothetical protein
MPGFPQSDDPVSSERFRPAVPDSGSANSDLPNNLQGRTSLEEHELEAALQLLVERAQYITGATGTALALPQGEEMVCRASAGDCAPSVGARLQVRSGLTGESIARRQLLRCDNAEADPRVNLETCRALGIASIVVLPLLRRNGEVRGLFELFSDHPYAFEERDLVALERMAALTLTALDLAEQGHESVAPAVATGKQTKRAEPGANSTASAPYSPWKAPGQPSRHEIGTAERTTFFQAEPAAVSGPPKSAPEATPLADAETSTPETTATDEGVLGSSPRISPPSISAHAVSDQVVSDHVISDHVVSKHVVEPTLPEPAPVPEAMRRIQKCVSCGFPVSEGRTLCLDCESLERLTTESEKRAREKAAREIRPSEPAIAEGDSELKAASAGEDAKQNETSPHETQAHLTAESSAAAIQEEILPPFLTNPQLVQEPWLARHVNLLAFLVLVAAVLVAAVVFFR